MDNFMQVSGRRIHYVTWGDASAPPVVLLHGQSGFWHDWSEVAPGLAEQYRVIAIDHPGFGDSDWDPTGQAYQPGGFAGDLDLIVQQLGLGRFVLAGHSFGGRIGLVYGCAHPDKLRGLVLGDSSPDVDPAGSLEARTYLASIPATFPTMEAAGAFFRKHYPDMAEAKFRERMGLYLQHLPTGEFKVKRDPLIGTFYRRILAREIPSPAVDWAPFDAFPAQVPLLLLRGTKSELLSPAVAEDMHRHNPRMQQVDIPDATHLIATEQPAATLKALRDFIAGLPA
jgi:esterase